ncbi:MAG: hypothetical protein ABS76_21510 [Pelagibacterium sp. SCN 64-44]|jgi:hypothetical protein|nr:MAG: hypothetical protein ABS76_21510 [Pelagibacterium sp. SCN 64-44]
MLSLGGVVVAQWQLLTAADERIADLQSYLAAANATIANLQSRATADAEVMAMPPAKRREELKLWVR